MNTKLHIELTKDSPAYKWLNTQTDIIGAKGHIGTHLDCYTTTPQSREYFLDTHIIDCRNSMPEAISCRSVPMLNGKGLILYTSNMEHNEYGSDAYLSKATFLTQEALATLITKAPLFILIDSHGIGSHGKEHIKFDKLCENKGCHVIENIYLDFENIHSLDTIRIIIDINNTSTGKPCLIYKI